MAQREKWEPGLFDQVLILWMIPMAGANGMEGEKSRVSKAAPSERVEWDF